MYLYVYILQVVASMDVNATLYRADTRVQERRKVGNFCSDHVHTLLSFSIIDVYKYR